MSNIALSTAGVTLNYGIETTAGTKPTAFTTIPDIKAIPELNPEPNALDSTDLSATEFKTYVEGLKDLGGALGFTANLTSGLMAAWDSLYTASATASADGKATWFQIIHPKLEQAVFFKGQPSKLGLPEMSVDSVLETTVYVTPNSAPEWLAKVVPTQASA